MEYKNLKLLQGIQMFSHGELNNVTLDGDAVVLEQSGGGYVLYGCYTSPAFPLPAFNQLLASWNADTPRGTVVEMQVRVLQREQWSDWYAFGKWSPYIRRCGPQNVAGQPGVHQGVLSLGEIPAEQVQVRVYLYTENDKVTPAVWLLAVGVHALEPTETAENEPIGKVLWAPGYSRRNRDPYLASRMDSAAVLASQLNRYGEDALPEELAWGMLDAATGGCENQAFAAALAGCYGYVAYNAYLSLAQLRAEIHAGRAVAVWLRGGDGQSRAVLVRGLSLAQGECVLLTDPEADSDAETEQSLPVSDFLGQWNHQALLVCGKRRGAGASRPPRIHCRLVPQNALGVYQLQCGGEVYPLPVPDEDGTAHGTLAYTIQDDKAWATTAHKSFCYLAPDPDGALRLPPEVLGGGRRITLYAIDELGGMLVGELQN